MFAHSPPASPRPCAQPSAVRSRAHLVGRELGLGLGLGAGAGAGLGLGLELGLGCSRPPFEGCPRRGAAGELSLGVEGDHVR